MMTSSLLGKEDEYLELVWLVLDSDDSGHIEFEPFMDIFELTHLSVKSLDEEPGLIESCFPSFYNSSYSKLFIRGVKHLYFRSVKDQWSARLPHY